MEGGEEGVGVEGEEVGVFGGGPGGGGNGGWVDDGGEEGGGGLGGLDRGDGVGSMGKLVVLDADGERRNLMREKERGGVVLCLSAGRR